VVSFLLPQSAAAIHGKLAEPRQGGVKEVAVMSRTNGLAPLMKSSPLKLDPKSIEHWTLSSTAYEASVFGFMSDAVELLEKFIRMAPDDPQGHLAYGEALACCARVDEAVAAYAQSLACGGEEEAAAEHIVRSVAAAEPSLAASARIDAEQLEETCRRLLRQTAGGRPASTLSRRLHEAVLRATAEQNRSHDDFPRRRDVYEACFKRLRDRSVDILFVVAPALNPRGGYPPYGIGILQEHLRQGGLSADIADVNLEIGRAAGESDRRWFDPRELDAWARPYRFLTGPGFSFRQDLGEWARELSAAPARALGFSCFEVNRPGILWLVPRIKAARGDAYVVLGGADCFYPAQCDKRYESVVEHVDAFVVGEGEIATRQLLEALREGRDPGSLPGLYRPRMQAPDGFQRALPVPAEDLKGFPRFDASYMARIPEPRTRLIATNRGCVNRCDFCYDHKAWQRFRLRDPDDVVEEIRYNIEEHGVRRFHLVDSATNASTRSLERLCDRLIAASLGAVISTSLMISDRMTPALFAKMKEAGFDLVFYGVESGSTPVLQAMGKRGGADEAKRNLRLSSQAGLRNFVFLIVGHPEETPERFEETVDFVRQSREWIDAIGMVNACFLHQESDLAERMRDRGVEGPPGWPGYSAWVDGDNHIAERLRRKETLVHLARDLEIPLAETFELTLGDSSGRHTPRRGRIRAFFGALRRRITGLWGDVTAGSRAP
jgi:hypothetical protein